MQRYDAPTKTLTTRILALTAAFLGGALACDDSDLVPNEIPLANAGPDQTVPFNGDPVEVTLDGTASVDPDGKIVDYIWLNASLGPENDAGLAGRADPDPENVARPTVLLGEGRHKFTLAVRDDDDAVSTMSTSFTVTDAGVLNSPTDSQVVIQVGETVTADPACIAASAPSISDSCKECTCAQCPLVAVECDDTCWGLVECVASRCGGDTSDESVSNCIIPNCGPYLAAATPATNIGGCATDCAESCTLGAGGGPPTSDAGSGGTGASGGGGGTGGSGGMSSGGNDGGPGADAAP